MNGLIHTSDSHDPYVNLATEEYLLSCETPVLYFWQNENTVVIGRNQNAFTECDMAYVRSHDVRIARRLTGGGAVYHDLGNLNYSLVLPKALHDIARSTAMLVRALQSLGIDAGASGRNDILLDGKKISGNAYYSNRRVGLHHGTILHKVDANKLGKALRVSPNKTAKHGVASVHSRVGDIAGTYPQVSLDDIRTAISEAFCAEYGLCGLEAPDIDGAAIRPLVDRYASDGWIFGRISEYDVFREASFSWGTVRVSVEYQGENELGCEIVSDSLEPDLIDAVRDALNGRRVMSGSHSSEVDDILSVYRDIVSGRE